LSRVGPIYRVCEAEKSFHIQSTYQRFKKNYVIKRIIKKLPFHMSFRASTCTTVQASDKMFLYKDCEVNPLVVVRGAEIPNSKLVRYCAFHVFEFDKAGQYSLVVSV